MGRGANNLLYGFQEQGTTSLSDFRKQIKDLLDQDNSVQASKLLFTHPNWNTLANRDLIVAKVYQRILDNDNRFFCRLTSDGAGERGIDLKLSDQIQNFFEQQLIQKKPVTDQSIVDYVFLNEKIPNGMLFYPLKINYSSLLSAKHFLKTTQIEWLLAYDQAQARKKELSYSYQESSYGQRKINTDLSILLDDYYYKRFRKYLENKGQKIYLQKLEDWPHMRMKELIQNSLRLNQEALFSDKEQQIVTNRQLLKNVGNILKSDLMIQEFLKLRAIAFELPLAEEDHDKIFLN